MTVSTVREACALISVVEHSSGPSGGSRYNPNGGPAGIPDISKVEYEGYESDEVSESGGQEVVTAVSCFLCCRW
jgi:hypothetical protein